MSEHPFTKPEGSDADMFIQWKGTEVCMDFSCACGESYHIDADFTYFLHCRKCDSTYEMGTQVIAKKVDMTLPKYKGVCITEMAPAWSSDELDAQMNGVD